MGSQSNEEAGESGPVRGRGNGGFPARRFWIWDGAGGQGEELTWLPHYFNKVLPFANTEKRRLAERCLGYLPSNSNTETLVIFLSPLHTDCSFLPRKGAGSWRLLINQKRRAWVIQLVPPLLRKAIPLFECQVSFSAFWGNSMAERKTSPYISSKIEHCVEWLTVWGLSGLFLTAIGWGLRELDASLHLGRCSFSHALRGNESWLPL